MEYSMGSMAYNIVITMYSARWALEIQVNHRVKHMIVWPLCYTPETYMVVLNINCD